MLDDLKMRDVIEGNNPVFITGLSIGGGMTLAAARRLGHRLTGVAALMPYDGEQPEPVPDLTGTPLKRCLIAYTLDDPGMAAGYHERLAPMPARWAAAMGIPASVIAAPEKLLLPNAVFEGENYRGRDPIALATRNSQVTEWDMVAPGGGAQVRVLVMDHAGHFWPNARQNTEEWVLNRWGFRNQDFDAADMVWEFLRTALE